VKLDTKDHAKKKKKKKKKVGELCVDFTRAVLGQVFLKKINKKPHPKKKKKKKKKRERQREIYQAQSSAQFDSKI
jgi:hypothetical protein